MCIVRPRASLVVGILLGACSSGAPSPPDSPSPEPAPQARGNPAPAGAKHGIPPGHMPAVGYCRIWIPGTPPGRQPEPKSTRCQGLDRNAPAGSWIVYRPSADRKVVHLRVVDPRRAGVVVKIRIYDIDTERFLREENP